MKLFKSNFSIKVPKKWAITSLFLLGALSAGIFSCSDDDNNNATPEQPEVESALLMDWGFDSPSGNGVIRYAKVYTDIPSSLDNSTAVELGLNVSPQVYNGNMYSLDNNSKTLTKWTVDRTTLDLSVESIMSYASTGINASTIALGITFVSDSSAFLHDFTAGISVEFSPNSLEITDLINHSPLPTRNNFISGGGATIELNGKYVFPVGYSPINCCDYSEPTNATIGVFDPKAGTVDYKMDERNSGTSGLIKTEDGKVYVIPFLFQSIVDQTFRVPDNHQGNLSILRLDDNLDFDSNYFLDLEQLFPEISIFMSTAFIESGQIQVTYNDFEVPSWDQRFGFFTNPSKSALIDLETLEVNDFTALDQFSAVLVRAAFEGRNILVGLDQVNGETQSTLLRQEGATEFTSILSQIGGTIGNAQKLW